MSFRFTILLLSLLSHSLDFITGFPFISVIPPLAGWLAYQVSDHLECLARECCKTAVNFSSAKLREDLKTRLHGQHIAEERLYNHVEDLVNEYKTRLQSEVRNAVASCAVSIFVFDEVHKMPPGVLNALVPFLGFSKSIDGLDFRRSIFIFIGNSGGTVINEYLLEAVSQGRQRSSIQYGDMRRNLAKAVFNEKGAFKLSNLIDQHLITALVPFLPLQEVHVRQCITDAAARMFVEATEEMKDFVVDELDWGPNDMHIFSESGCKLIYEKVGFYLQHSGLAEETDNDSILQDPLAP